MQLLHGFAVTLLSVERARQVGVAVSVAGPGCVFLLATLAIQRKASGDALYAHPSDFRIETAHGEVIECEQLGMSHELTARHLYHAPLSGVIGFKVPAHDKSLRLYWRPGFNGHADAQAAWLIGQTGKTRPYYR